MAKTVRVTRESPSGRNQQFYDPRRHSSMNRPEFVKAINAGKYPDYHIRKINGIPTPVSNPDGSQGNNLD